MHTLSLASLTGYLVVEVLKTTPTKRQAQGSILLARLVHPS